VSGFWFGWWALVGVLAAAACITWGLALAGFVADVVREGRRRRAERARWVRELKRDD